MGLSHAFACKIRDNCQLLLAIILLGFFFLWGLDLGLPAFSGDEAFVAIQSTKPASEIIRQLNIDEPHPPAYYLTMHLWFLLVGSQSEFLVRYPSILAGLFTLSLTFAIGLRLGLDRLFAFVPVLAIGLNPQITVHVREARMYGPMIASVAFAILVGLRFNRLWPKCSIWSPMLATLLALLTHYFNTLFVATLGAWGILCWTGKKRRSWVISQGMAWGIFAGWLVLFGKGFLNPATLGAGKPWSFVLPPWETFAELTRIGVFGYRYVPESRFLIATAVILLIVAWLMGSLTTKGWQRQFLFLFVLGPLAAFALAAWYRPIFHAKYVLPWLVIISLSLGFLVFNWRLRGIVISLGLLGLTVASTWRTIRFPYDPGLPRTRGDLLLPNARHFGEDLAALIEPDDIYGECTPNPTHKFYTNDYLERPLGYVVLPDYPEQSIKELTTQISDLLADNHVLWYLDCYNEFWDPLRVAAEALNQQAILLGNVDAAGHNVQLYTSPRRILERQQPVQVRFGQETLAEIEGVWQAIRGNSLYLVIVWRSLAEQPEVNAKVFVHLVDEGNHLLSQSDGLPVVWTRPFPTWHLNEQLMDVHTLDFPANSDVSELAVLVGVYDPDTSIRLPAYERAGEPLPDNAAVIPLNHLD